MRRFSLAKTTSLSPASLESTTVVFKKKANGHIFINNEGAIPVTCRQPWTLSPPHTTFHFPTSPSKYPKIICKYSVYIFLNFFQTNFRFRLIWKFGVVDFMILRDMQANPLQWTASPGLGVGLETTSSSPLPSFSQLSLGNLSGGTSVNSLKTRGLFLVKAMEGSRTASLNGHAGNAGT